MKCILKKLEPASQTQGWNNYCISGVINQLNGGKKINKDPMLQKRKKISIRTE